MADTYKSLSALYAQRKEEQAKALGALESYNQQKQRAQASFMESLDRLAQISEVLSDIELVDRINTTVARGRSMDFSPENIREFARELDAVIKDLETQIKEKLA